MAPRSLAAGLAVAALLVSAGCEAPLDPDREKAKAQDRSTPSASPSPPAPSSSAPTPASGLERGEAEAQARKARRQAARAARRAAGPVLAISVDGLNPSALTELGPGRLPSFYALISGGASTLNARTETEITETLPNHTGMLTGRPIEGPDGHGVDFNDDSEKVTVSEHAGRPIASVFDVAHAAGRSTALYASKDKFALFQRSWSGSIDRSFIDDDTDRVVARLVDDLGTEPADFTFVHLASPDKAGHASGFMGEKYLEAVEQVDDLLGRIRAAVTSSSTLRGRLTIVLTADHGGAGSRSHSDEQKSADYRIPFVVSGPSVRPGSDLYSLNPDYRDPGTGQPAYDGAQPVRNGDLADLSTRLLGLGPVPGSVFGARDRLDVR